MALAPYESSYYQLFLCCFTQFYLPNRFYNRKEIQQKQFIIHAYTVLHLYRSLLYKHTYRLIQESLLLFFFSLLLLELLICCHTACIRTRKHTKLRENADTMAMNSKISFAYQNDFPSNDQKLCTRTHRKSYVSVGQYHVVNYTRTSLLILFVTFYY